MAKGKHTGSTKRWKKGESGNPNGRPKTSPELRVLMDNARSRLVEAGFKFGEMTVSQIRDFINDPKSKGFDLLIASAFTKAISGSLPHFNALMDRLAGPVPRAMEVGGKDGEAIESKIEVVFKDYREE